MNSKFQIGQKIVCVNNAILPPPYIGLDLNAVYTVRGVRWYESLQAWGVYLAEVKNKESLFFSGELSYNQNRFRRAVERPTDISIFTEMLTPNLKAVLAEELDEALNS